MICDLWLSIDSDGAADPATPISSAYEMVTAFVLCLLLMTLSGCAVLNPTMPIKLPIDLSKAGSMAEAEFWMPQDDRIKLSLYFFYTNDQPGDGERLSKIVGNGDKPGTIIPVKIQIVKYQGTEKNELMLEKNYLTVGQLVGFGSTYLYRIIDYLTIKSGSYRLRVENMQSIPQLVQTPVEFRAYYVRAPK